MLTAGTKLGPYEIAAPLGAGGMGEVYRARDTKLGRDVALKVLPAAFANDPERMARFQREAQVLASLNHPNIAAIYGLEDSGSVRALVMELVDGPTLADRIAREPIPLDEALPIARQIAEGLEYAHESGIVHRDLKPANVKVTAQGGVKILDFGLAKAFNPQDSALNLNQSTSPTLTVAATQAGVILGTAAYMSPEQAGGKVVDKRSDIWAFGVVLYEMLTGARLFTGDSVPETLAGVFKTKIDLDKLPEGTPSPVRRLLRRCLERNPKDRLRDIGDAKLDLRDAQAGEVVPGHRGDGAPVGRRRWLVGAIMAAAVLATFGITRVFLQRNAGGAKTIPARLTLSLSADAQLAVGNFLPAITFSPDGESLAYVAVGSDGVRRLAVRRLDSAQVTVIPGTEGAEGPFFSPDGQWIGYWSHWKVWKVRDSGAGVPEQICRSLDFRGGAWAGHTIIFAPSQAGGLSKVDDRGGQPQAFTKLVGDEYNHRYPHVLPDGDTILFTSWSLPFDPDRAKILAVSLSTGKRKEIGTGSLDVLYSPTGHLLYVQGGRLLAVPFDPAKLEITGDVKVILDHVVTQKNTGAAQFAVSPQGNLAWAPGGSVGNDVRIVRLNRRGERTPILETHAALRYPSLSPDERKFLVMSVGPEGGGTWLMSTDGKEQRHLDPMSFPPAWLPDGRRWVGTNNEGTIFVDSVDGTSARRELVPPSPSTQGPGSVSATGMIAYSVFGPKGILDTWLVDANGGAPKPFLVGPADEGGVQFSPDGRYVAYVSNRSGQFEVYVTSFPDKSATWQISTAGGSEVVWQRDGKEITFRSGSDMVAVPVTTQPTFHAGSPSILFHVPYDGVLGSPHTPNYDVARDGSWFLMIDNPDLNQPAANLQIALDWPVLATE